MLANVALPAFLPHSLATGIGIFVIAAIEAWFLMRLLKWPYGESYRQAFAANWKSTIVGIPVAWLFWMVGLIPVSIGLSAVDLQLHPIVAATALHTAFFGGVIINEWAIVAQSAAWLLLLIPFWFGSVWIEKKTILKRRPDCDPVQLKKAVVRGNLASYSIFLALGMWGLSNAIADLPNRKALFEEFQERQREFKQRYEGSSATPGLQR